MTTINQRGFNGTIWDTRGRTSQRVEGSHNRVTYRGDSGANRFHVGGHSNRISINEIGSDDHVFLEGRRQDWTLERGSSRDGVLTYRNKHTGNKVRVATDAGRNDAFVQRRVHFTGNYGADAIRRPQPQCWCPTPRPWPNVGHYDYRMGELFDAMMHDRRYGTFHGGFGDLSPWQNSFNWNQHSWGCFHW